MASHHTQHFLSFGLKKLYRICTAETCETRCELLDARERTCDCCRSLFSYDFLIDALEAVNEDDD
jgi:hypothetical protein